MSIIFATEEEKSRARSLVCCTFSSPEFLYHHPVQRRKTMDKRSSKRTGSQQHETSINDTTVDSAVAAALATQQQTCLTIIDAQLKTFQACLQACMDATNNRIDTFVRETITDITELKASLQYTQNEVSEMKQNVTTNNDQRVAADRLLEKLDADVKRVDDTTWRTSRVEITCEWTASKREARRDVGGHRGGPATSRREGVEAASGAGRRAADRASAPHRGNVGPA